MAKVRYLINHMDTIEDEIDRLRDLLYDGDYDCADLAEIVRGVSQHISKVTEWLHGGRRSQFRASSTIH